MHIGNLMDLMDIEILSYVHQISFRRLTWDAHYLFWVALISLSMIFHVFLLQSRLMFTDVGEHEVKHVQRLRR